MNDEFSINQRIIEIIKDSGLTNKAFAEKIGVQSSSISQLSAGRNKPGLDFIQKVLTVYKNIDAKWLLTGIKSENQSFSGSQIEPIQQDLFISDVEETKQDIPVQPTVSQHVVSAAPRKQIEKIVTFYTDKTFSESYPE